MGLCAQVPTYGDCLGAIPLCGDSVLINFAHPGMGNYANEINAGGFTCYTPEGKSIWISFTIQQSGVLRFELNPVNQNQDHDWILFDMSSTTCAQLANAGLMTAATASSNTWGAFGANGSTGISSPNGGVGNCNGPGAGNGPKWNADLPVVAGTDYVLYITNWSTPAVYGFTVDFSSSTAVLYDTITPKMDTITSSTDCDPFNSLSVQFSEPIKCDSTHAADFQLIGPGGVHTVTGVSSAQCLLGQDFSDEYTLTFTPPVSQVGNYKLKIISGAGYVEDACGNLDINDSLEFNYNGTVGVELTGTNLTCYGECEGTIEASITAGEAPFTFNWNNGLPGDSLQSSLCAGQYIVTVTDDAGCTTKDTMVLTQPAKLTSNIDTSYKVSCPGTSNCDGGARVVASGGTSPYYYQWPSNEFMNYAHALCAGINYVTVTDANGCLDTVTSVNIAVPDSISTSGFGDTLICITNFAAVAASSSGGTPPFSYVWTEGSLNGPVVSITSNFSADPAETTSYFVQSTDLNGCIGDTSVVQIRVRPKLGLQIPKPDTICPYDTISVTAYGTGGDSIYTYSWSSGDFGPTVLVSPDVPTWYTVTVADKCGTPQYVDSVFQQVGGYSPIKTTIRVEDDSLCPGESVYLIATGAGGYGGPDEFSFTWEHTPDGNRVQFVKPSKTTEYFVTIDDLCLSQPGTDTLAVYVGITEVPEVKIFPSEACAQNDVVISIDKPLDGYTYSWDMGDDWVYENVPDSVLIYQYSKVGCYDLSMDLISDFGCKAFLEFPCGVKVLEQPTASFTNFPKNPTNLNPQVTFVNGSIDAEKWRWYIEYEEIENESTVIHEFSEFNDYYEVSLVATSEDGCMDTVKKVISFEYETTLFYPSSFTPNGDGLNDCFSIAGDAIEFKEFDLVIYDRWGHQIFKSINPSKCWDGKNPTGQAMNTGSYPFTLKYLDSSGEIKVLSDQVIISSVGKATELR